MENTLGQKIGTDKTATEAQVRQLRESVEYLAKRLEDNDKKIQAITSHLKVYLNADTYVRKYTVNEYGVGSLQAYSDCADSCSGVAEKRN